MTVRQPPPAEPRSDGVKSWTSGHARRNRPGAVAEPRPSDPPPPDAATVPSGAHHARDRHGALRDGDGRTAPDAQPGTATPPAAQR